MNSLTDKIRQISRNHIARAFFVGALALGGLACDAHSDKNQSALGRPYLHIRTADEHVSISPTEEPRVTAQQTLYGFTAIYIDGGAGKRFIDYILPIYGPRGDPFRIKPELTDFDGDGDKDIVSHYQGLNIWDITPNMAVENGRAPTDFLFY
ncbi:hypothetical protein D6745_01435 [Candidatus Woesearchaeota archaeon]|nr:MAG: hypothetical protein D6745_01435 [Candidatus Woesearchaeota archaeon]